MGDHLSFDQLRGIIETAAETHAIWPAPWHGAILDCLFRRALIGTRSCCPEFLKCEVQAELACQIRISALVIPLTEETDLKSYAEFQFGICRPQSRGESKWTEADAPVRFCPRRFIHVRLI